MSENGPLYGVWLKSFGGWLCNFLGHPLVTPSLGKAIGCLLVAKTRLNTEYVMSPISGDVFSIASVYPDTEKIKEEKLVVRSLDEWAKSEGLIE